MSDETLTKLTAALENAVAMLKLVSPQQFGRAILGTSIDQEVQGVTETNEKYKKTLAMMAEEFRDHVKRMEQNKGFATDILRSLDAFLRIAKSRDLKEATDQMERFLAVCERFQKLKEAGTIDKIIEAASRL